MKKVIKLLLGFAVLCGLAILAWPLVGAASSRPSESKPLVGDLLPPEWTPPEGITFHYAEPSAEEQPAFLPGGTFGPGIYAARDYLDLDPAVYPIVGSHRIFYWNELEPIKGSYRWDKIHEFISRNAAKGKKTAFGISTYDGVYASRIGVPDWFIAENGNFGVVTCPPIPPLNPNPHQIPRYWNQRYLDAYRRFVLDMGSPAAGLDGNPNVAWIAIGTGLYGENQPSHDDYNACLQNEWLTDVLWASTSYQITQMYLDAFQNTPVLFQYAPIYLADWERKECSDYAAMRGAGLMHDGLVADREKAYGSNVACNNQAGHWDPIVKYWRNVPIAFETYRQYLPTPVDVYWGFLNGLSKHADYFNVGKCLLNECDENREVIQPITPRTELFPIFRFVNRYAGRTLANTPSVWIALRETELSYCPDRGNFSFWLYQDDDAANGRTVPVWNVGTAREGRYTRRTDQATGNRFMYFDVDDGYIYGGTNSVVITVRYLDQGTDRWQLQYHAPTDVYKVAGEVIKQNTSQWLTATFQIDDARFANGQAGANDFRIDCLGDGDEYIHFVDVRKTDRYVAHIPLRAGYNFISLPVVPEDPNLPNVLSSINGMYEIVRVFVDGQWKVYRPDLPPPFQTLTQLDEKMGIWIKMTSAATLSVPGTPPTTTMIPLRVGYNHVGYPATSVRPIEEALASIEGKYDKVRRYKEGVFGSYIVGLPPPFNAFNELEPGLGYLIRATEAATLIISN